MTARREGAENGSVLKTIFICKIPPKPWRSSLLCSLAVLLWLGTAAANEGSKQAAERATQRVAQVVDYVAADYAGAVRDGQVIEASEYAEQADLLAAAR